MELTGFAEANTVLGKPSDMSHEDCTSASVLRTMEGNYPVVISCWKVTAEELAEIQRTGRVWLKVVGNTMPPAYVSGVKPF